ncbi:MAG: DegT/DnrJ/EryC1/StrS family aminotransferase [Pseudomonadota bacterium]
MKRERIHSAGPSITQLEIDTVTDAATTGFYSNYRNYIEKFETEFAKYVGAKYAIATTSATTAMHLMVVTAGLGPGDEVIVPDLSWIASASVHTYAGATPVFVDIEPDTWTISPEKLEAAITPRTKAVMPVDLYGHAVDYDAIVPICRKHGLTIIADSAPAVGTLLNGRSTASYADMAAYSFQGAKMMITGEGGMFVTNDEELFRKADQLAEDGRTPGTFWIERIGYHYRMSNLSASLGYAQLQRVEELVAMKRQLFDWYHAHLGDIPGISMFKERANCRANCSYPSILLTGTFKVDRDGLREQLRERRIDTRPIFPVMSQFPMFETVDNPVARRVAETGINLPTAAYLDQEDVADICNAVKEILGV